MFGGEKRGFKIVIGNKEISKIRNAYAEGAPGEVFGILGSMGYLEIAANRGAASKLVEGGKGSDVNIVFES